MNESLTRRDLQTAVDHARDRILAVLPTKHDIEQALTRAKDLLGERARELHRENETMAYNLRLFTEQQQRYDMSVELRIKILERELQKIEELMGQIITRIH